MFLLGDLQSNPNSANRSLEVLRLVSQISQFGHGATLRSGLPSELALLRRACLDGLGSLVDHISH